MLVAEPGRILARGQVIHALVGKPGQVGVEHADVDLLSVPGGVAMA